MLLQSIPIVGPAASEIFALIGAPAERRRDEFLRDLAERLSELEKSGRLSTADLSGNDPFVDTALRAIRLAIHNSQPAKQEAFRNAILNAALPTAADGAMQQMFIDALERFTDWHLRILRYLNGPRMFDGPTTRLSAELMKQFPDLRSREKFVEVIWRDLDQAGMVEYEKSPATTVDVLEALQAKITDYGVAFYCL